MKSLNSLERVCVTLEHEEPDKVPLFDFLYNHLSLRKFVGSSRLTPSRIMKVWLSLGFDLVAIGFNAPRWYRPKWLSRDVFVDEWGVKARSGDGMSWYLDGTIKCQGDLDRLPLPNPSAYGRTRTLEWALRRYGDKIAIAPSVAGPFTQTWSMMGFHDFARALYCKPGLINNLIDVVNGFNIEMGKRGIDLGVEFVWIADDFGGTKGPMISPKHFRAYIIPRLRKMVNIFKRRGVKVLLHCDGNVMPIMGDIVGTGIDAFHPIERKCDMDLALIKEEYGEKIALIGNLEASHLIPTGRLREIDRQIRECFRIAAPGGGYIFASDHSIHPGISAERARFVFNRAKRYRSYRSGVS